MSFNSPPRDLDDEYGAGAEDAMSAADIFADLSNHLEQCGDCYPGALCKIGFDFAIKVIGKNRAVELRNEADQRYGESPVSEQATSDADAEISEEDEAWQDEIDRQIIRDEDERIRKFRYG